MPEDRRNQELFDFEGLRINAAAIVADPQTKPSQIIRDFYFDVKAFGMGKSVSVVRQNLLRIPQKSYRGIA